MTNGEKLQETFKVYVREVGEGMTRFYIAGIMYLTNTEWWNAEYKEPNSDIRDNRVKDELNRVKDELGVASGLEKNSKKLEKDFGELDCISREEVLKLMKDNWHTHNGDWAMQESMDDIRALPSVTPQEPRRGHWIVEKGGSYLGQRNACCSNCKDFYSNDWNVMSYCPNCGARMIEPQESEG